VASLAILAAFFSFLNSNERVTLDVGFTVLYRISLVGLVFGSFLLGMIAMFLFGLRYDRKVRDALREHGTRGSRELLPPVAISMPRPPAPPREDAHGDDDLFSAHPPPDTPP